MNKRELIGQVLLRVSGGRPTSDMSVRETDIRSYIAPAINMAIDESDDKNRALDDGNDRDYNSEFYGQYRDIPIDQTGDQAFAMMEDRTVPLKGNNGLRLVYDDCGNYYGRLSDADRASIKYYENLTPCMSWYYRLGQKLMLWGVSPLAERLNYDALTNVDDLGDDDELPLIAGTEARALDILFQLVTGQIQSPYDPIINHDDINKANIR